MAVRRLRDIHGFAIDRIAAAADDDPGILRLENLDTDLLPPEAALAATHQALESLSQPGGNGNGNSYLPFTGQEALRTAVADRINRDAGTEFTGANVVITNGGTEAMFDALLAMTRPLLRSRPMAALQCRHGAHSFRWTSTIPPGKTRGNG